MSGRAFSEVTNIIIVSETSDNANITYSGGSPSKKFGNLWPTVHWTFLVQIMRQRRIKPTCVFLAHML